MLFTWEATPERAKEGIGKNDGEGIQANKGDVKELVTLTGYGLSPTGALPRIIEKCTLGSTCWRNEKVHHLSTVIVRRLPRGVTSFTSPDCICKLLSPGRPPAEKQLHGIQVELKR